jgi:hypothetical protein
MRRSSAAAVAFKEFRMILHGSIRRSLVLSAALALAGTASAASAQERGERELFGWNGSVDREVLITMRGQQVWAEGTGSLDDDRGRTRVYTSLPREEGWVTAQLVDGRGQVDVLQQPSARHNYTTIIRLRDPSSGEDRYDVRAYWRYAADRADGAGQATGRIGGPGRIGDYDDDPWYDGRGDRRDDRPGNGRGNGRGNDRFERTALRWMGNVDGTLEIRIQGDRIRYRELSGREVRGVRTDFARFGLPRRDVFLRVDELQGRGTVRVVQQPSARNGYTAVIQIRDPQSGYGRYTFDLLVRPDGFARGY